MELNLKILGVCFILLGVLHLGFPWYFNWKEDLKTTSLITRQMMYTHSHFIGLVVGLIGMLCLGLTNDLISTSLGHKLALTLGIFWLLRLVVQFFGYSPALWRGKPFETSMHILFSAFWIYASVSFFMVYYYGDLK